ncbi:hypothetical protein JW916_10565 [Candidatus Sumerlaeota bacterium]|nr:hypothetical protein [Candidatus Sumerlaeota bacterium]
MRDLTPLAQQESARTGVDVAWILSVAWPDGDPVHYSHRAVNLVGASVEPCLLSPGKLTATTPRRPAPSSLLTTSRLVLELGLDSATLPAVSPTVRERLDEADIEGLEIEWGVVFLDSAGEASLSDRVTLFWGIVEKARISRQAVELECLDWLSVRGRKRFGTVLAGRDLPEAGIASEGRMPPWIFGALEETELLEWRTGLDLALDRSVSPDDTTIALESVESLPDRGVVQIGDERIDYDAIDRENRTLGTAGVPLVRSEAAYHPAGSAARWAPSGSGFEWLVAGHACRSVSDVRSDGLTVDPGDYSVATEEWRGETVQKIVFAKWPYRVEHQTSTTLIRLNGAASPGIWDMGGDTTAEDADLAIDDAPTATCATLHASAKILSLEWRGLLANGERRYGLFDDARLRIRVGSDRLWETTTRLRLRFLRDGTDLSVHLPRPYIEDPDEAARPYGPVDLILELGEAVEANGGWSFLDGADDSGFEARVELDTGADTTQFQVYDVALEIDYFARRAAQMAGDLSARVEGVEENEALLDNPAHLVRFFLCDSRALGLDTEHLDEASFSTAATRLDTDGYRFSNRLAGPTAIGSIVARLLFESRCRLDVSGDRFALRFDEGDSSMQSADFDFDGDTILRGEGLLLDRDAESDLTRAVYLHYGRDFGPRASAVSWRRHLLRDAVDHRPPYSESGVDLTDRLQWHNHGDAAPVADLARALLGRYGFRRETVEIAAPLKCAALEPGDRVRVEDAWFPLDLDPGEVAALAVTEPHRLSIRGRFAVGGRVCWRHDALTFMRHRSSDRLLEFWIEGVLAAALTWDGVWRLRGRVLSDTVLYGTFATPIAFAASEDRLYFSTGESGTFTPRFALDSQGDLLIAGILQEETPRGDLVLTQCNESSPDRFILSVAGLVPAAVFEVSALALQLRGEASENERFY